MISHSISKKVDMVRDVIREEKKIKNLLETIIHYQYHPEEYGDALPRLLVEKKLTKKVSNASKCRIKNNKGEYIDIKKVRMNDKDDSRILELTPQEDDSNLIPIGTSTAWGEGAKLLERIRKRFQC